MTITRRTAALSLAAAAVAPAALAQTKLSPQDEALVEKATVYLQGLGEAMGRFVQTDPQGRVSEGTFYLKRPGKARFDYDPPSGLVVVSDGAAVTVADNRLKTFTRYPLGMTPLALFLAKTIRLDRGVEIAGVERQGSTFTITARDGHRKNTGQLQLTFTDSPVQLISWAATDARGATTRVRLIGLSPTSGLRNDLFVGKDPRRAPERHAAM
ncbi:MAG: outer-membrane lipoprotein carrier protein LolA [Alphaproteobacteria bacterium]|nr:outer-membrane lipoprotein carrier protein LolA [Alphaproteobacteria bacterium]